MSWLLLLIQLIPTIVKIIEIIQGLIKKLPRGERQKARAKLSYLVKSRVKRHMASGYAAGDTVAPLAPELQDAVVADFEAFRAELEMQVG